MKNISIMPLFPFNNNFHANRAFSVYLHLVHCIRKLDCVEKLSVKIIINTQQHLLSQDIGDGSTQ